MARQLHEARCLTIIDVNRRAHLRSARFCRSLRMTLRFQRHGQRRKALLEL